MLRSLLALALALAPAAVTTGCTGAAKTEVELVRTLVLTPVDDSKGALKRVAEAVRADPQSGLEVESGEVAGVDGGPAVQESFATGPEKHVLEDYIRTHPELAPPADQAFGYERLRDGEGRTSWRMHCVRAGGLALRELAAADLIEGPDNRPRIRVRLVPEDSQRFAALTAEHRGRRLAVIQDDEVLTAPMLLEPLNTGELEIPLAAATRAEAQAALDHLLGR
ncbi:SecDF P1 head subdomain-containing protein [Nannocystis pusilla]|uniref:SecDF P1 head subdomain-containing protein n=1 Tax=Nannocystis pusilla TaxID=889268 RepID=UPI003BF433A3